MKKILAVLAMVLMFAGTAFADSEITFEWDANSEGDLVGYRLYQSDTSGSYTFGDGNQVATITAGTEIVTITGITDGTYFWVLTAYDTNENESGPSNEVTKTIDNTPPAPPQNFWIALIQKIVAWFKSYWG